MEAGTPRLPRAARLEYEYMDCNIYIYRIYIYAFQEYNIDHNIDRCGLYMRSEPHRQFLICYLQLLLPVSVRLQLTVTL
jgi:hypothetical protein